MGDPDAVVCRRASLTFVILVAGSRSFLLCEGKRYGVFNR